MEWKVGVPPYDGKSYLMLFKSGIVCSGRLRQGELGEPQQSEVAHRCDCCGRFATPIKWAEKPAS